MRPGTKCKICRENLADHKCDNCGAHICDFCEAGTESDQKPLCPDCKGNDKTRRDNWRGLNDLIN